MATAKTTLDIDPGFGGRFRAGRWSPVYVTVQSDTPHTADLSLHETRAGDRYLLCSDGLTTVVPAARIHQVLRTADGPEQAVAELIGLANSGGGPDNIACVAADVVAAA